MKVSISCTTHACSSSECSKKCKISTDMSSPWKMSLEGARSVSHR